MRLSGIIVAAYFALAGPVMAQPGTLDWELFSDGVDLEITGPDEIGWGEGAGYELTVTIDGKPRKVFEFVDWSQDGQLLLKNASEKTPALTLAAPKSSEGKYATGTAILKASVMLQRPEGDRRYEVSRNILISSVAAECEGLLARISSDEARAAAMQTEIAGLLSMPEPDPADSVGPDDIPLQKSRIVMIEQEMERDRAALKTLEEAQDGLVEARGEMVRLRSALADAMPDAARIVAANARYKTLESLGRKQDKIDFVRGVFGDRDAPTPSTPTATLDALVDAAHKKAVDTVFLRTSYALHGIGGLVGMIPGGPGGGPGAAGKGYWYLARYFLESALDDRLLGVIAGKLADDAVNPAAFIQDYNASRTGIMLLDSNIGGLSEAIAVYKAAYDDDPDSLATQHAHAELIIRMTGAYNMVQDRIGDMDRAKGIEKGRQLIAATRGFIAEDEKRLDAAKVELASLEARAARAEAVREPSLVDKERADYLARQREELLSKVDRNRKEYTEECEEPEPEEGGEEVALADPDMDALDPDDFWPAYVGKPECGEHKKKADQLIMRNAFGGCSLSGDLWDMSRVDGEVYACEQGWKSPVELSARNAERETALLACEFNASMEEF